MSPLFQGRGTCSEHCCLLLKGYQQRKFSKVLPSQVSIWGQHQCPLISATESLACWLSLLWLITQPVVFRGNNLALRAFMYVTQAGTGLALYRVIAPTKEETCLSRLETNNPCFLAHRQWGQAHHRHLHRLLVPTQRRCSLPPGPGPLSCHFYAYFLLPLCQSWLGCALAGS